MGLYESGWNPPGTRKDWERTSMECHTTATYLRTAIPDGWGDPVEAVAWFDDHGDGRMRVLIADFANGRRLMLKHRARDRQITLTHVPAALFQRQNP